MELWLEIALCVCVTACVAGFLMWPARAQAQSLGRPAPHLILDLDENGLSAASISKDILFPNTGHPKLSDIVTLFQDRFPELTLSSLTPSAAITLTPHDPEDHAKLVIKPTKTGCRVVLQDYDTTGFERHQIHRLTRDCADLKRIIEKAPYPIWTIESNTQISYGNPAFHALSNDNAGRIHTMNTSDLSMSSRPTRIKIVNDDTAQHHWYDVTSAQDGATTLHYALDVSPVVKAEIAQRNFVQTLTKTFAQLSIGLAIFDKNRQLVLFNPALIDLTELPAEFLSARPNLLAVFDKLRDNRIMPEPKDYGHWREKLAVLVASSAEGTYTEVWNLPTGSTYRVSGRPHPDGAIAFLFEDISAEISLTRKFRYELDLVHSVFDTIDTAVVVFSASGQLLLSNESYGALWGHVDETSMNDHSILDASKIWQTHCAPSPIWGDLREFVMTNNNRTDWDAEIKHQSGQIIQCRVSPIGGGATLILFQEVGFAPSAKNHSLLEVTS